MDELHNKAEVLRNILTPMVAMVVASVNPRKDVMTKNQAYKEYSRRWVDDQVRRGNLAQRYSGKRVYISRADVELLIAAEREGAQIV